MKKFITKIYNKIKPRNVLYSINNWLISRAIRKEMDRIAKSAETIEAPPDKILPNIELDLDKLTDPNCVTPISRVTAKIPASDNKYRILPIKDTYNDGTTTEYYYKSKAERAIDEQNIGRNSSNLQEPV